MGFEAGSYDLTKFRFVGWLSTHRLAQLFDVSTLHIYLTTPFPLSWSCISALACGAKVLGSDTEPVREVIKHGSNGLLANFFDVDGLARQALNVLRSPSGYDQLGRRAAEHVRQNYATDVTAPRLLDYFRENANSRR